MKYNIGYNWIHNLKIDRQSLIVYIFYKNVFLVINFKFGNLCCARSTVAQTAEPATWYQKVSGSIPVWTHWNALLITTSIESCNMIIKDSTHVWIRACPKANSRAAPSVEAHQCVHDPNTGRNSGKRWIKNKIKICTSHFHMFLPLGQLLSFRNSRWLQSNNHHVLKGWPAVGEVPLLTYKKNKSRSLFKKSYFYIQTPSVFWSFLKR